MTDFKDLQEIWTQQSAPNLPDVSLIIDKADKEKRLMARKIIFQVMGLVGAIVGVSIVVCVIEFKMITTYIGIILMILAVAAMSFLRLRQVVQLKKFDLTSPPNEVLANFERFYSFQKTLNTTGGLIYFITLNIAFALYFIEVLSPLPITPKVITLALYVAWMLVAYFIIGKRHVRREHEKSESIINAIKKAQSEYNS